MWSANHHTQRPGNEIPECMTHLSAMSCRSSWTCLRVRTAWSAFFTALVVTPARAPHYLSFKTSLMAVVVLAVTDEDGSWERQTAQSVLSWLLGSGPELVDNEA